MNAERLAALTDGIFALPVTLLRPTSMPALRWITAGIIFILLAVFWRKVYWFKLLFELSLNSGCDYLVQCGKENGISHRGKLKSMPHQEKVGHALACQPYPEREESLPRQPSSFTPVAARDNHFS